MLKLSHEKDVYNLYCPQAHAVLKSVEDEREYDEALFEVLEYPEASSVWLLSALSSSLRMLWDDTESAAQTTSWAHMTYMMCMRALCQRANSRKFMHASWHLDMLWSAARDKCFAARVHTGGMHHHHDVYDCAFLATRC